METGQARMLAMTTPLGTVPVRQLNRGKSWIRPDAGKQWLLYVSDGATGTIDIYNYRVRVGKLYGQITGLSFPYGQCLDRGGNVYVVDNETAKIYEFAHGGTTPIATASDAYGNPIGCSVDPTNGDVAVANFNGASSGPGGLVVFAGGLDGSQTNYTNSLLYHLYPPGYDPHGDLFVQGTDYSGNDYFAELRKGSGTFDMLSGLTIAFPGSVGWDGSYITATDQDYQYGYTTMIYRLTVSGSAVTIVGKTNLTDDCYPNYDWMVAVQPFVGGPRRGGAVAAGNLNCPNRQNFFSYADGGNPKRSEPSAIAPKAPYGQVVSPPKG
ncbi:MAG: hypothetical protein WA814_08335 [Candidatus Baltobacteraceae bacterium]